MMPLTKSLLPKAVHSGATDRTDRLLTSWPRCQSVQLRPCLPLCTIAGQHQLKQSAVTFHD